VSDDLRGPSLFCIALIKDNLRAIIAAIENNEIDWEETGTHCTRERQSGTRSRREYASGHKRHQRVAIQEWIIIVFYLHAFHLDTSPGWGIITIQEWEVSHGS
jgi:hypothetical protein